VLEIEEEPLELSMLSLELPIDWLLTKPPSIALLKGETSCDYLN